MQRSEKSTLQEFLKKVKQLRGYGDMNSYSIVQEAKEIIDIPETEINNIISEFEKPQSWNQGKKNLIDSIEQSL